VTNILEVFLYHRTATESCEEALVELIDYCYRKFVNLISKIERTPDSLRNKKIEKDPKAYLDMDNLEELERQYEDIEFSSTMTCLSLIRFITDHMEGLPVSIAH
jgi:hypothetical protein